MTRNATIKNIWILAISLVIFSSAVLSNAQEPASTRRAATTSKGATQTSAVSSRLICRTSPESPACLQSRIADLEGQVRELQERLSAGSSGGATGQVPAGLDDRLNSLERNMKRLYELIGDPGKYDKYDDIWTAITKIEKHIGMR